MGNVWQALDAGGAVYLVGEEGGYTRFGGSSARAVWLWDAASGERLFALEDSASTDGVIWSPTGNLLAGDAAEGVIRLWDSSNGYVIRQLGGHDGSRYQELTFSPDELELVVTDSEGTASLWDIPSGTLRFSQEEAGKLVGWSADQAQIAFQEEIFNAPLNVFDAESGERLPAEGFPRLQTDQERRYQVYWDGYNPVEVRDGNTVLHELEHAGRVSVMVQNVGWPTHRDARLDRCHLRMGRAGRATGGREPRTLRRKEFCIPIVCPGGRMGDSY